MCITDTPRGGGRDPTPSHSPFKRPLLPFLKGPRPELLSATAGRTCGFSHAERNGISAPRQVVPEAHSQNLKKRRAHCHIPVSIRVISKHAAVPRVPTHAAVLHFAKHRACALRHHAPMPSPCQVKTRLDTNTSQSCGCGKHGPARSRRPLDPRHQGGMVTCLRRRCAHRVQRHCTGPSLATWSLFQKALSLNKSDTKSPQDPLLTVRFRTSPSCPQQESAPWDNVAFWRGASC